MPTDLQEKLREYVALFNGQDEELYPQTVPNTDAFEFLAGQIPLFECPDPVLEQTYYYRWWTLRKHWKTTPDGHILTEFHPPVGWAGPNNSICAAAGHHIREARWLRDGSWTKEYLLFWLNRKGQVFNYSTWYAVMTEDFLRLHPDAALEKEALPKLLSLFNDRAEINRHDSGLFWSQDGRDAMELSISGSGVRPTLNSYMIGDARAIAHLAAKQGLYDIAAEYDAKADHLTAEMNRLLWDGDFYRVIPCEQSESFDTAKRPYVPEEHCVREQIGFIPWYFHIPDSSRSIAFRELLDEEGFAAPAGITTAERRHPRFMFKHEHECLWNGPVWPYATSQTLTGLANHLRDHGEIEITKKDYYSLLRQYAKSHVLTKEDGRTIFWIDEDMDPFDGHWIARTELKADNWNPNRGGYERGKDYNHSTFCDLVLSGLLGIEGDGEGGITCAPLIPEDWDYFRVTNLTEKNYTVLFDRTGEHYHMGKGLFILR